MAFNTTILNAIGSLLPDLTLMRKIPLAVVVTALIIAASVCLPHIKYKLQISRFPLFLEHLSSKERRAKFLAGAKALYKEGHDKFKASPYRMQTLDEDQIVLPLSMLSELRKAPEEVLSFYDMFSKGLEETYTYVDIAFLPQVVDTIKRDLTPKLSKITSSISNEVDATLDAYLPSHNEWTEINTSQTALDIIAKISAHLFIGSGVANEAGYLDCTKNFTVHLGEATKAIKGTRVWLRPLLAPRLPEVKRLLETRRSLRTYVQHVIDEREAKREDPNWVPPEDMMQWLLNRADRHEDSTLEDCTAAQVLLILGTINASMLTLIAILHTLAVTPEYLEPLREEIRNTLNSDGSIPISAMKEFGKLDSYFKEVGMHFPVIIEPYFRRVRKGLTLSNGQYLPPGVAIVIANPLITDRQYENFDGFRHYKLRETSAQKDKPQHRWLIANESEFRWGYDNHVCPGRFYAHNLLKIILARLIEKYDIKMPGDVTGLEARYACNGAVWQYCLGTEG
ncbi:ent-kaurene oxidase [Paraphoma chrysanthemicola]|uniref:Ent-kaurene oxidase n=1 Tax=Paraphoma chrysanthemicola TaxID=798071 RepID=A0A8K0R5W5_9PLEO|nr:ent-kaurene oxidase [Paraphoma chrysanthemicola]